MDFKSRAVWVREMCALAGIWGPPELHTAFPLWCTLLGCCGGWGAGGQLRSPRGAGLSRNSVTDSLALATLLPPNPHTRLCVRDRSQASVQRRAGPGEV